MTSILINCYFFWAGINLSIHLSYGLIIILSLLYYRINGRFACLAYVIPSLYFLENILMRLQVIQESFHIGYYQLVILVGALHFIEGILTFYCGSRKMQAVITYKGNEIIGGYEAYGRWIVPLFLCSVGGIFIPIIVCIVYYSETFTKQVKEKAEAMGIAIAGYGVSILLLIKCYQMSMLSLFMIMVLMPIMHEALFVWDHYLERGKALYAYPKRGIRLMGFANMMQLPKPFDEGDIFLEINQQAINNETDYEAAMNEKFLFIHIKKVTDEEIYVLMKKAQLKALQPIFLPPQ